MNPKKDMIESIIRKVNLKEKVDAAFSEAEEQMKARLMEELENAMREKLQKELEKKAEQFKKKARKRMIKTLITSAILFCSGFLVLSLDRFIPISKKEN